MRGCNWLPCTDIGEMIRENIDLALAVQRQVRAEFAEADRSRASRIGTVRCQAVLARRGFIAVDPANRLVAAALEAEWNERLRELDEACREGEARAAARDRELSAFRVERIRAPTRDFEEVWTASGTTDTDRKRLLGLLTEDATPTRDGSEVTLALRMRGGGTPALDPVQLPPPLAGIRRTRPKTIAALAGLLDTHADGAAALAPNHAGHTNRKRRTLHSHTPRQVAPYLRAAKLRRTREEPPARPGVRQGSGTGRAARRQSTHRLQGRKRCPRQPEPPEGQAGPAGWRMGPQYRRRRVMPVEGSGPETRAVRNGGWDLTTGGSLI